MLSQSLTLKQIEQRLRTRQHVLIHLCEKGVIEPEVRQTNGRGTPREFSTRNLFEFVVALAIRQYGIPVTTTAVIIRLLRSFERSTQRRIKGFNLLGFLQQAQSDSNILLLIYDGHYMVFGVETGGELKSVTGFDIGGVISNTKKPIKIDRLAKLPQSYDSYLKLDLKRLARKVTQ